MSEQDPVIGVLLCDCNGELSKKIDFSKLASFTKSLKDVKFVRQYPFLCGDQSQDVIKGMVEDGVERFVIAACSPKLYEPFFMHCLTDLGLNPYLLEIANLREQCAWVHPESPDTNEKAIRVLAAAIEKVRKSNAIPKKEFKLEKSVIVIGGGIAGLQAAIDIADFGYKVHLIEKAPVVGGNALKLGLAFPSNDGAFCISSPNFLKGIRKCFYRAGLFQHPNIDLLTLSQVDKIRGSFGNFEVSVSSQPRGVLTRLCITCGKCTEVCPIEVADEINYNLNKRKAIYLPHPNASPAVYCIDWKNCTECGKCMTVCPTKAITLTKDIEKVTLKVGAIIVATGFQEYDPSEIKQYGYNQYDDVITQLQLARILDPYGPFKGELLKPSDKSKPKSIVMIQCVGSRDVNFNSYCSKICCTIALKHAILLKEERAPDAEIYICYMDIRTLGKNYEDYFSKARELGVKFIRGRPSEVLRNSQNGKLIVEVEDTLLNQPFELDADLIVLSAGMVPASGTDELAKILQIELDENGFVKEIYPKLKPIETSVKGIYVCGGAQSPKDIPESITQAEATAFRAILDLSKNVFEKDMDLAYVERMDCDGCEQCVDVCSYHALEMKNVDGNGLRSNSIVEINEIRCARCGLCTNKCPTGALQLQHYTSAQMLGQLRELLSPELGSMQGKILAFCCNECGYATVDMMGMAGMTYPTNLLPLRVPCLGWVSLFYIFKAFEYGADAVLLVGCLSGNCQQINGNKYADKIVNLAKNILNEIGISESRLKIALACAANPLDFYAAIRDLTEQVKQLGPITKSGHEKIQLDSQKVAVSMFDRGTPT